MPVVVGHRMACVVFLFGLTLVFQVSAVPQVLASESSAHAVSEAPAPSSEEAPAPSSEEADALALQKAESHESQNEQKSSVELSAPVKESSSHTPEKSHQGQPVEKHSQDKTVSVVAGMSWFVGIFALLAILVFLFT
jgi:cobalamin biosynthesis Mg chelatase CobN